MRRLAGRQFWIRVWLIALLARGGSWAAAQEPGFVGDGKCGNPKCHGAGVPSTEAARATWQPWMSARTQWLNSHIDHHSRAYRTLETPASKQIAGYMGIQPTASDKCLTCHAPAATVAVGSAYRRSDGVTCEHCHGGAERWLKPHVEKGWRDQRAQFAQLGFLDNADFAVRAERCASCHVAIDHEIVAAGHPPLQFEMVAYAQVMKHWNDQRALPAGSFSVDPTLWSVGQITGLRRVLGMIVQRAGASDYQGLGTFAHFEGKACYQCHHKLVEDAIRQGQGHAVMVDAVVAILFPERRGEFENAWREVGAAAAGSAAGTREKAGALTAWLAPVGASIARRGVDRDETRKILDRVTAAGDQLKVIRRFSYSRPQTSNVVRIDGIDLPWWYTTGAPEQAILAIQALCEPAVGAKCTSIDGDLRKLLAAVDRFDYRPEQFAQELTAINRTLFRR